MSLTPSQLAAQTAPSPQARKPASPAAPPSPGKGGPSGQPFVHALAATPAPRAKRCPSCGMVSAGHAFFCAQCGADISLERSEPRVSSVPPSQAAPPPVAAEQPASAPAQAIPAGPPAPSPVVPAGDGALICPQCSHSNPGFAILCMSCGADLALATPPAGVASPPRPAPAPQPPAAPVRDRTTPAPPPVPGSSARLRGDGPDTGTAPRLQMLIGNKSFDCKDGDILGRAGTLASDLFAPFGTVSRQHASIVLQDNRWFIVPSPTVHNATRLDGVELKRGEPTPLTGEHTLALSTKCEVKLRIVPNG